MHIGDERIATSQGGGVVDVTGGAVRPVQDPNRGQYKNEQQALGAVAQALATVQDQVDDAKTLEKDNQAVEAINNELTNFESLKGQAAINAKDEYSKKIETIKTDLSQGLDNNMQRQMLEKVLSRRLAMANGRIGKHYAQQSSVYKAGQLKARADNTVNEAVSHLNTYGKPGGAYNQSKIHLLTTVDEIAEVGGLGPEQTAVLKRTATTGLHTLAIKKLVTEENPKEAKRYLDENKHEIDEKQMPSLKQLVETETLKDKTIEESRKIQGKIPNYWDQIVEAERKRKDGKLSDALYSSVMVHLKKSHTLRKEKRNDEKNSVVRAAKRWADANRDKSISDMDSGLRNSVQAVGEMAWLGSYMENTRHVTLDNNAYTELLGGEKLRNMSDEQFEAEYRTKLSDKHFNHANNLRIEINDEKNATRLLNRSKLLERTAAEIGLIPKGGRKKSESENENYINFLDDIEGRIRDHEIEEYNDTKTATRKDVEGIISKALSEKAYTGGFFGYWRDEVPIISIPLDERGSATVDLVNGQEITLKELAAVKAAMIDLGYVNIDDPQTIADVYEIMQGKRPGILPSLQAGELDRPENGKTVVQTEWSENDATR